MSYTIAVVLCISQNNILIHHISIKYLTIGDTLFISIPVLGSKNIFIKDKIYAWHQFVIACTSTLRIIFQLYWIFIAASSNNRLVLSTLPASKPASRQDCRMPLKKLFTKQLYLLLRYGAGTCLCWLVDPHIYDSQS